MKKVLLATVFLAIAAPAYAEGRPKGCPHLYCGCWLAKHLGIADRTLNRALSWLRFKRTTPHVGAVAVLRRRGGGHVGIVVHVDANGNSVTLLSGNTRGGRVGVGKYPKSRVLAYVEP